MWAGQQCASTHCECGWRLRSRLLVSVGRLIVKGCGVAVSEAAGEKLGVSLVERNTVNMGTDLMSPSLRTTGAVMGRLTAGCWRRVGTEPP